MGRFALNDDVAEWDISGGDSLVNDIEAWLERYIKDREANGKSPKTISSYRDAVSSFIAYSTQHENDIRFDEIGAKYINNYIIWYQNQLASKKKDPKAALIATKNTPGKMGRNDANLSIAEPFESSIIQRITILKQMLSFVTANNRQQHDFTRLFPYLAKISSSKKPTGHLSRQELNQLIAFLRQWPEAFAKYKRREQETAWRDALIGLLYCYTAARADEVLSLRVCDITEEALEEDGEIHDFYIVQFETTKGDKYRESAVKKELLVPFIERLRLMLPEEYYISSQWRSGVFINKKMADSTMYRFITWCLGELGINKSGRHIIRRGIATEMLGNGYDIGEVALELGHTSTATTFKHYIKNNKELTMRRKLKRGQR